MTLNFISPCVSKRYEDVQKITAISRAKGMVEILPHHIDFLCDICGEVDIFLNNQKKENFSVTLGILMIEGENWTILETKSST